MTEPTLCVLQNQPREAVPLQVCILIAFSLIFTRGTAMALAEDRGRQVLNLPGVLRANFAKWSEGRGKLTLDDINRLIHDRSIRGADAAAISVLKECVFGSAKGKPGRYANLFVQDPKSWDSVADGLTLDNIKYYYDSLSHENPLWKEANALNDAFLSQAEPNKKPIMPPAFSLSLTTENPWIDCLAFSPDGKSLAIGGAQFPRSGELALWDLTTARRLWSTEELPQVCSLAFSPDGKYLACGEVTGAIQMRSTFTGELVGNFKGHIGTISFVQFTPDGKGLVASDMERITVWEVPAAKAQATFRFQIQDDRMLTFLAGRGREGRGAALRGTPLNVEFTTRIDQVYGTALSPDGKVIAVGVAEKGLISWERESGKVRPRLMTDHPYGVGKLDFSPDGQTLATTGLMDWEHPGTVDRTVRLWDLASGRKLATFTGTQVCFSRDGKMLLTHDRDAGCLRLREISTGKVRFNVNVPDEGAYGRLVGISPDGKMVATVVEMAKVHFWDVATGKQVFPGRP
jgi:WD40 repeat protein